MDAFNLLKKTTYICTNHDGTRLEPPVRTYV